MIQALDGAEAGGWRKHGRRTGLAVADSGGLDLFAAMAARTSLRKMAMSRGASMPILTTSPSMRVMRIVDGIADDDRFVYLARKDEHA